MADAAVVRRFLGEGLSIEEQLVSGAIVRLRKPDAALLGGIGAALTVPLPQKPNSLEREGGPQACWLAPGEWAVFGAKFEDVQTQVARVCAGAVTHHVADIGEAWRCWRVSGEAAEPILANGCPLDLEGVQGAKGCARTLLGQTNVLLVWTSDGWTIYAERALAQFIWAWFSRAGRAWNLCEAA
ncbi:sarcosine oxidase gamma subunit [alpha proteobacterium U9-1i]|nr:sarcosine oxidase gamma subunit [alpha proteobacterium U9-1i]